ncbi:hypothetical protein F7984_14535 [Pradoshia sp. D12]|uniref:hypothetical protein n=1 Tax=Bacillaceae TaxID=186817 RepID=UPI001127CF11|nr:MULTISPECIES: hypothetical protein [Bacillaceae]QFK72371.1 hypothetical protein F7984_14535 [Pradoshia sp. D12]TPF71136.1 hypothetical protein FHY44_11660 [Bacillus sp. D12]
MKKIVLSLCLCSLLITACQKEYKGEYIKWGEKTNSNATELLKKNGIPYKIKDGIIYIPEDAFDKSIYCCA